MADSETRVAEQAADVEGASTQTARRTSAEATDPLCRRSSTTVVGPAGRRREAATAESWPHDGKVMVAAPAVRSAALAALPTREGT